MMIYGEPISDRSASSAAAHKEATDDRQDSEQPAQVALFRLLMREPSADHDFRTCQICRRFGITTI
jgi:hypothetical protein